MATKFETPAADGESFLRSRGSPRHPDAAASGASGGGPTLAALLSANNISPRVQRHLVKVYTTLLMAVACAAGGAALDSVLGVGGMMTTLAALAVMAALAATPASPATLTKRTRLLAAFSALQGASLGPLISLAAFVDPSLIAVAFVGAALVFACFSLAALLTRRRSLLALGGVLSTAVTSFLWLHLAAILLPRSAFMLRALSLELYLGVFVFSGYILFDSQLIIERASAGSDDHVAHALDLFVDLAALFARLLAVLVRNAAQREERGEGGRREGARRRRGGGVGASRAAR
jgi:Bax inhibitor 1